MKIRIKENSMRFRLTRSEVEEVCTQGSYEEHTLFGQNHFTYRAKIEKNLENLSADFSEGTITLYIPQQFTEVWLHTDRVGFEYDMPLNDGKSLYLLLEKDFVCMDDSGEDQTDNYPNPLAQKLR